MATYSGVLNLIGDGTSDLQGKLSKYSVIEIGEQSLRNILCPTYLTNYLNVGSHVEVEVGQLVSMKKKMLMLGSIGLLSITLILVPIAFILANYAGRNGYLSKGIISITTNGKTYRN